MPDESPTIARRLPKRIVKVSLPNPYAAFSVELWVNIPPTVWNKLMSDDLKVCAPAFDQLVISHDLVDFDGQPYPQPDGQGSLYRVLPNEVISVIVQTRNSQVGRLSPPSALS